MVVWLSPDEAIRAIEGAKAAQVPLLGFDGAFVREGMTQPSLDDSWDYTSRAYPAVEDPYGHAIRFIRERSARGLHFEVVLGK